MLKGAALWAHRRISQSFHRRVTDKMYHGLAFDSRSYSLRRVWIAYIAVCICEGEAGRH
jgi:hypothetical protein